MLGLPEQEILGKNWFDHFLPAHMLKETKGVFAQLMAGDVKGVEHYENRVLTGRGEERCFAWNNSLLKDEAGRITGMLSSAEDITERKQAEHDAQRLRDQLIQATKMEAVGHLTAGIAHDFNNILGAILGYAELSRHVTTTHKSETLDRYLDAILKSCYRAKELVSQMLTFSRLSPDTQGAVVPAMLLAPVVKEVVTLLRSTIPSTIVMTYPVHIPDFKVHILPIHLHQIILNLGINARDAIGEYGELGISLETVEVPLQLCASCHQQYSGEYLKLSVCDTGTGVSADILKNIFDPFFTTKEVGKGTGMGLSVVHGLVHSAGGHIDVQSTPGRGTAISILLPLADQEDTRDIPVIATDSGEETITGVRIMVVDDESALATLLHEFLSMHGAQVSAFDSPLAAWQAFEQHPERVDIVITDETMPGLSGMHLAKRMLALRPGLPVILCSGYSEHVTVESAAAAGLAGFFIKPVQMSALRNKIYKTLQNQA